MTERERLELYTSIVPSERQKMFENQPFNVFIHFGTTTFTRKEWGDGTFPPEKFNPKKLDTDQWCESIKQSGATGIILTCKHHDGFCLWQTKTTEYSIKNSPYKNGKGDIVKELSDSCRKYGLKFGVYLSPWDRNSEYYSTPKYNDFYIEQLKELLTNYGDIYCVWLDGACGSHLDGKPKQVYDFPRIYKTVYELSPTAVVSNCGPDVRWVGNEAGVARESEWNVVPKFAFDVQSIEKNSQQEDDDKFKKKTYDVIQSDLGSREFIKDFDEFTWYPAEVDVSIRPRWFYHKGDDRKVRSLNNLLHIYNTSVGGNSLLLLNIPPNRDGIIHEKDVKRLKELGDAIRLAESAPVTPAKLAAPQELDGNVIENVTKDDESYYTPSEENDNYTINIDFGKSVEIDRVYLKEQCDFSQRIETFEIYAKTDDGEKLVYNGTTVGLNRYAVFNGKVKANGIKIVITSCRLRPYIMRIQAYEAKGIIPKKSLATRIAEFIHRRK